MSLCTTDVLLKIPSSTSKYCVIASRADKDDEEVKEGEDEGRTEMQKSLCSSSFPFHHV